MAPIVILLLILLPLAEIQILWRVGEWIGAPAVLGLLLLGFFAGGTVIRGQGLRMAGKLRAALQAGQHPGESLLQSILVMAAGVLLIIPGFLSDLAALLLLLLPPLRRALARWLGKRLLAHFRISPDAAVFCAGSTPTAQDMPDAGDGGRMHRPEFTGIFPSPEEPVIKETEAKVIEEEHGQKYL